MAKKHTVDWNKVDEFLAGLETTEKHEIEVRREAIPLVFVPGIMGTHLRRPGTDGKGEDADELPNLRWSTDTGWMLSNLIFACSDGARRRSLLVGTPDQSFDPNYLEVDEDSPPGDGFRGIMEDYHKFLKVLREHDWGLLSKYFVLPVYAVGYNWSDDVKNAGTYLAKRIDAIIEESRKVTGLCEKVILISHSMGGLVTRTASEISGAQGKVAGIIHGVQPVTGAPGAYWRMKAGFEGFNSLGLVQRALGNDGPKVTAVLGNIPGGLQLMPNKVYQTTNQESEWLTVTVDGNAVKKLPENGDPYAEIYRIKAIVHPKKGENPSQNIYWGLVDPELLNPEKLSPEGGDAHDAMSSELDKAWDMYLQNLKLAETLHDELCPKGGVPKQHPHTLTMTGIGHKSVSVIEMRVESNWVRSEPYPNQGFRGFFTDAAGKDWQAVLQDPAEIGDGTVPWSSGAALETAERPKPGDVRLEAEHQPAYEDKAVQAWAIEAVTAMVKQRYHEQRKGK
jgi:PGAP1-like protein